MRRRREILGDGLEKLGRRRGGKERGKGRGRGAG
jgi:hypothetical protein